MMELILKHPKAIVIIIGAIAGITLKPVGSFVMKTLDTQALVGKFEPRIDSLERSNYGKDAILLEIRDNIKTLSDRQFQMLNEARQLRREIKSGD